jgi:hypothetical protein
MEAFNRSLFIILGIVLVAIGVTGLLAAAGVLPLVQPSDLYASLIQTVRAQPLLWWSVLIIAALLLVVLGLWLVRAELSRPRVGGLHEVVLQNGRRGATSVEAAAVADAAARDLARLPQVLGSDARLATFGRLPRLEVRLDVPADADLDAVRQAAEGPYDRLRTMLGVEDIDAHVRLRPTRVEPTRVR